MVCSFLRKVLLKYAISVNCCIWLCATAAHAVVTSPIESEWLTLNGEINHMRVSPKDRFIAYVNRDGLQLQILDTKDRAIYKVSDGQVGGAFFWAPDGYRLFYRALVIDKLGKTISKIFAYDCGIHKNIELEMIDAQTGFLTFSPKDLQMQILSPTGIKRKKIFFPDQRLAKWQIAKKNSHGNWLASPNGMLWVTKGGLSMRRLEDDGSAIESFDVSPDGTAVAWATHNNKIYISKNGENSKFLDHGKDPHWHPDKLQLVYAGARMVGDKVINFDLKISDWRGSKRFLTATQFVNERWPQYNFKNRNILYTKEKSAQIFSLVQNYD